MKPSDDDRLMQILNDYLLSAKNYYLYSRGRVLTHMISFIFVNANKWFFNIFNALFFVIVGRLM